jgi:phenylpropionate dioxygenase-like ring-hydroxylating dioxygenase large terminal subunit
MWRTLQRAGCGFSRSSKDYDMSQQSTPQTLPGRYYTDPAIFREEMERFYFNRWICAGRTDQVPHTGAYFLRDVAGESIIVTREAAGAVRAFFNVCRHRGTRMCAEAEGSFEGRIRCPYHGWTYALDGSLISAPNLDRAGFSRSDYPLHTVAAEVWEGHIFLNFAAERKPVASILGELTEKFRPWRMSELRLHKRIVYHVKANWKLIVLNYNECLHCPVLHPALNRLTDYLGADNQAPTPDYIGGSMGFCNGAETMSVDGVRRRAYLPGLDAEQRKMVCYYAIYPNLLLSLHPDYMMTHTLWPKAVDRTEIVCEWHFHPDEMAKPGFQAEDAIDFWDQTNREDWGISQLSQLGISSRAYTPGPYSRREELLHAFDETIR